MGCCSRIEVEDFFEQRQETLGVMSYRKCLPLRKKKRFFVSKLSSLPEIYQAGNFGRFQTKPN
jgi:hypothetical protein